MPAKLVIERKVRWVLALIVILMVAIPVLALRGYLASRGAEPVHSAIEAGDERLVSIDGRSMIVQPNALGETMTEWLKSRNDETLSFELGDHSFMYGTAIPAPITTMRINQVAAVAKANPNIIVHLLLPSTQIESSAQDMDRKRAERFREGLIARGMDAAHVQVDHDEANLPTTQTARIAVLLSKEGRRSA